MIATSCFTLVACAALVTAPAASLSTDPVLAESARQFERELRGKMMPYWFDSAVDRRHGGFLLEEGSKQLVAQTRMIWGFSHAHRLGLSTPERDYLAAALRGMNFCRSTFATASRAVTTG